MKVGLVFGDKGEALKPKLQSVRDDLDIGCFLNIPSMLDMSYKRGIKFDRLLLTSSVIRDNQELSDLFNYWSNNPATEIVVVCRETEKDLARVIMSNYTAPQIGAMVLTHNANLQVLAEAILQPIDYLCNKYGTAEFRQTLATNTGVEIEQPVVNEPQPEVAPQVQQNVQQPKSEKKTLFGALFGKKDKQTKGNAQQQQVNQQSQQQQAQMQQSYNQMSEQPQAQMQQDYQQEPVQNYEQPQEYAQQGYSEQYPEQPQQYAEQSQEYQEPQQQYYEQPQEYYEQPQEYQGQSYQDGAQTNGDLENASQQGTWENNNQQDVWDNATKQETWGSDTQQGVWSDGDEQYDAQEFEPSPVEQFSETIMQNDQVEVGMQGDFAEQSYDQENMRYEQPYTEQQQPYQDAAYNDQYSEPESQGYGGYNDASNQQSGYEQQYDNYEDSQYEQPMQNENRDVNYDQPSPVPVPVPVVDSFGNVSNADFQNSRQRRHRMEDTFSPDNVEVTDFSDMDLSAAEEQYRQANEQPKVIERVIEKEVIKTVGTSMVANILSGVGHKIIIVTGDRNTGVTSAALNIAQFFSKKVPVLYFDCDIERHGVLNYVDYESLLSYEEIRLTGIKHCKSTSVFDKCAIPFANNFDLLTCNYDVVCTRDELAIASSVVASVASLYGVVVVDCPFEHIGDIADLVYSGVIANCVEASKRGYMNMLCTLEGADLNQRIKRMLVDKGTILLTKMDKSMSMDKLQAYIRSLYTPEAIDWLSPMQIPFNGKVEDKMLDLILSKI